MSSSPERSDPFGAKDLDKWYGEFAQTDFPYGAAFAAVFKESAPNPRVERLEYKEGDHTIITLKGEQDKDHTVVKLEITPGSLVFSMRRLGHPEYCISRTADGMTTMGGFRDGPFRIKEPEAKFLITAAKILEKVREIGDEAISDEETPD